jgi:hypothetical protein
MLIFMVLLSNIGILLSGKVIEIPEIKVKVVRLINLLLVSTILYSILYISALNFVPPLEDQDSEVQGTAYGLMHELEPYMVTNRQTVYFFAHPLLHHFYIGNAFLFLDELDEVSYYHDSALEAKGSIEKGAARELLDKIWERDFRKFIVNPHLLATRMSNLFFGVLLFYFLVFFLYSLTNSFFLSMVGPFMYFTFPEVFVRSSYGGYMAIENLSFLLIAYLYYSKISCRSNNNFVYLLAGIFGGLVSQKIVVIAIPMIICDIIYKEGSIYEKIKAPLGNKILQGILISIFFFAGYGLIIDPPDFINDFLMIHMMNRFRFNDVRFIFPNRMVPPGTIIYPSIYELWMEFSKHLGFPFLLFAVPISVSTIFRTKSRESFFGFWFLAGSIIFSVADVRQTKNLMLVILPLIIPLIVTISRSRQWVKYAVYAVLIFIGYHNIRVILRVAKDFSTITPSPFW